MWKINNKGYMLVEIILASVIAMIVAYFVIDLTIKLKNKNDDLLVKTLVYTDQAIIYNTIMDDIYNSGNDVNCDYIDDKISIDKENNVFKYGEFTNVVSEYASIGDYICIDDDSSLKLGIPIEVKQLPDDNFDIIIGDVEEYISNIDLDCSLKVNGTTIEVSSDVSNLTYYGWDSSYIGDNSTSKIINGVGTYTYYVKNKFGNTGSCRVDIKNTVEDTYVCGVEKYTGTCTGEREVCQFIREDDECHHWVTESYTYSCEKIRNTYCTDDVCESGYTKINDSYCYKLG